MGLAPNYSLGIGNDPHRGNIEGKRAHCFVGERHFDRIGQSPLGAQDKEKANMGLVCKIKGHAWNKLPDGSDGCTCARCGERRNEGHDWHFTLKREEWTNARSPNIIWGRFFVCSVCKRWETERVRQEHCTHDWDGCTCKLCGLTRNEGHDWDGCKCMRCGKTREEGHDWDGCTCKRCGKTRNEGHDWRGDRCARCNRTRGQTCQVLRETGSHTFKQQKGCRRRCTECGYTMTWHEFRNGTCMTCGIDESDYYAKLIISGKVKYEDKDDSGNGRNRPTYGNHVKTVAALQAIAMSVEGKPSYKACLDCARKLHDIAGAGGADAHDANVALYDIVMEGVFFWDTPEIARWITEPELASDPAFIKCVQEARKKSPTTTTP